MRGQLDQRAVGKTTGRHLLRLGEPGAQRLQGPSNAASVSATTGGAAAALRSRRPPCRPTRRGSCAARYAPCPSAPRQPSSVTCQRPLAPSDPARSGRSPKAGGRSSATRRPKAIGADAEGRQALVIAVQHVLVRSPIRMATTCSIPKRSPVRTMADIAFCASSCRRTARRLLAEVAMAHGCDASPKTRRAASGAGNAAPRRESSALSLCRSMRLRSSDCSPCSICRRRVHVARL